MKDKRSIIGIRIAAVKRLMMWHYMGIPLNLVLISEFPKSGGTWFAQMMAEYLELPFPRNIAPNFESCIMHGHHLYHPNFGRMIAVIRDGRDIMISAYYHFLFENDRNNPHSIVSHRRKVGFSDYNDIRGNLPKFIEYMFTDYASIRTHFSWAEFVNSYLDNSSVCVVRYEDLLTNATYALNKCCNFLGRAKRADDEVRKIVNRYSFEVLSKRKPGQESNSSFLRKGVAGDWKNKFTREACVVFDKYAGNELVLSGYENGRGWY